MKTIEYFYSAHSAFAYFGSSQLMAIANAANARIDHRPIDLLPVVAATGPGYIGALTQARRDYFFGREIERWSQWRGAPIARLRPTHHDNDLALASGVLIAAQQGGGNIDALSHAILQAHWRDDADIADADTLARIAGSLGIDGAPLLTMAMNETTQDQFRRNTREAIARHCFGSPTYVVDGDMFYGQDRLEFVERALTEAFA